MKQDREISMEEFNGTRVRPDLIKLREELDRFRAFADIIKENVKIQASITKTKYDALIAEGFTSPQAIELCKGAL